MSPISYFVSYRKLNISVHLLVASTTPNTVTKLLIFHFKTIFFISVKKKKIDTNKPLVHGDQSTVSERLIFHNIS